MSSSFTQMFEISRSGLMLRLNDLDTVSNNLANINTIGFKQQRTNFQELLNSLYTDNQDVDLTAELSSRSGMNGIQISSTQILLSQGAIEMSGDSLDLAIEGEGFFGVYLEDGTIAYTRNGDFSLDTNNQIVNSEGYPLVWDGTLPELPQDINVSSSGEITVNIDDVQETVGYIPMFRFTNPSGLDIIGDNLYQASEISGEAQIGVPSTDGYGTIANYALEMSNVSISKAMTRIVTLQRGFEMSIQALQQSDTMLQQALQMRQA